MKNFATHASKRTELARRVRRAAGAIGAALVMFTAPKVELADDGIVVITPAGTTGFGGGCGGQTLTLDDNSRPTICKTNFARIVDGATQSGVVGVVLGRSQVRPRQSRSRSLT